MYKPLPLFFLLVLSVLTPFAGQCRAAAGNTATASSQRKPDTLLAQMEKRYTQIQSLECSFQQRSRNGGRIREGSGQAFFFKPGGASGKNIRQNGVIRWEYHKPQAQTIINDGQEIRFYSPAEKQLLISPAATLDTDLTYALFTGQASLTESFTVSAGEDGLWLSPPPQGLSTLLLVPKTPQSQLKYVQLGVNKDLQIERLLMEDHFNAITELSFSAMRIDGIRVTDSARIEQLRTLTTTEDTEIIRQ